MSESPDDLQLIVDLVVQDPVLHKLALFYLLDGIHFTVVYRS